MREDSIDRILLQGDLDCSHDSAVSPPIHQTANFEARDADEFEVMANEARHPRYYSRYGNPTNARAAAIIAKLEGAEAALLFPSGMSAMTSVLIALLRDGDHVVCQKQIYAGVASFLETVLREYGVETTFVDQTNVCAFSEALRPTTRLIVLESPAHPLHGITDLRAVSDMAKTRGALTVIDNTSATPVNQRPLKFGIDLVVHSATKYLSGHSDVVAGAVAGSEDLIERIWRKMVLLGGALAPFDAWLLLRGLRTLALRVERQNENGLAVAQYLSARPAVRDVYYPGLKTHPQHALACEQMSGFGGVVSVSLKDGYRGAGRFIEALQGFRLAASLGVVQSLAIHPAAMWAALLTEEQLLERGIEPGLVRLSLGIDAATDLIADISQALHAAST